MAFPYYDADAETQSQFRAQAFVTGYRHGSIRGLVSSPREVYERFPKWATPQVEAYLNGQDDGLKGDATRFVPVYDGLR